MANETRERFDNLENMLTQLISIIGNTNALAEETKAIVEENRQTVEEIRTEQKTRLRAGFS